MSVDHEAASAGRMDPGLRALRMQHLGASEPAARRRTVWLPIAQRHDFGSCIANAARSPSVFPNSSRITR
ncbi:MAG: hypothetical protein K0M60_17980 [Hydrogenophaga sp.]|nr:hypothetical protein [Hydrogenophaga sp.]